MFRLFNVKEKPLSSISNDVEDLRSEIVTSSSSEAVSFESKMTQTDFFIPAGTNNGNVQAYF